MENSSLHRINKKQISVTWTASCDNTVKKKNKDVKYSWNLCVTNSGNWVMIEIAIDLLQT